MQVYLSLNPNSYCTKTYTGHLEWVRSVVSSEDGRLLVTASNDQVSNALLSLARSIYLMRKTVGLLDSSIVGHPNWRIQG